MAQVKVTISGKTYRMACDDGEEAHLAGLAERLDRSIEQLRARFGEIGDQRLTVMAAITLADQQAEAERRLAQLEAEVAEAWRRRARRLVDAARGGRSRRRRRDRAVAERIEAIAAVIGGAAAMNGDGGLRPSAAATGWRGFRRGPISSDGEAAGRDRRHVFPGPYRS